MLSRLSPGRQGLFKDSWKTLTIRFKATRYPGSIYIPTGRAPAKGWPLVVTDLTGDMTAFEAAYRRCVVVRCPQDMIFSTLYSAAVELAQGATLIDSSRVAFFQSPSFRLPTPGMRPTLYPKLAKARVFTHTRQLLRWDKVNNFTSLDAALTEFLES